MDVRNPNYELISSSEELARVVEERLAPRDILAVDTEGTSLDYHTNKLLLLQVGTPRKAYIFDIQKISDVSPLKKILENPRQLKLVQNGKFDYGMIKVGLGIEMNNMFDTMLAERCLTNGQKTPINLGYIADKYLGVKLEKDWESYDWGKTALTGKFNTRQLRYAALDVLVLFPIFNRQFKLLEKDNLARTAKLEFSILPAIAEMEIHGTYIDVDRWRKNINSLREKRNQIAHAIQDEIRPLYRTQQIDLFGNSADAINLNSQPQLMDLLNDKLGLAIPSTGVAVLSRLNHPVAKMLLEYRGHEKLISAFGENLLAKIHPKTGRLHPDYMQFGAETGRFACSNPNLQQIPRGSLFRSCFVAPPGRKLVTVDYSQIELRIMADYSGDPTFINAYKSGEDLHTLTASQMFGIPKEKVRKDVERFQSKAINFGLMYGRGANSLAAQLGITPEKARKLLQVYFTKYGRVRQWLNRVSKEAVKRGYSTTKIGRRRYYLLPDASDPNYERMIARIEREAKNTPIQGSSADMVKYAIYYTHRRLKKEGLDAYLIHTVHDEIVTEAADDQAEQVLKIQKEEMIRAGELLMKRCPVAVDGEVSQVWEH